MRMRVGDNRHIDVSGLHHCRNRRAERLHDPNRTVRMPLPHEADQRQEEDSSDAFGHCHAALAPKGSAKLFDFRPSDIREPDHGHGPPRPSPCEERYRHGLLGHTRQGVRSPALQAARGHAERRAAGAHWSVRRSRRGNGAHARRAPGAGFQSLLGQGGRRLGGMPTSNAASADLVAAAPAGSWRACSPTRQAQGFNHFSAKVGDDQGIGCRQRTPEPDLPTERGSRCGSSSHPGGRGRGRAAAHRHRLRTRRELLRARRSRVPGRVRKPCGVRALRRCRAGGAGRTPVVGPVSRSLQAKAVVDGAARGTVLALDEPLSFWGGVDPTTGVIVDRHHPQADASVAGTVLVLPGTRGSAGGSGTLAECLRLGTGPAAISSGSGSLLRPRRTLLRRPRDLRGGEGGHLLSKCGDWPSCFTHLRGFPGIAGVPPARAGGPQWTTRRRPAGVQAGGTPAIPGERFLGMSCRDESRDFDRCRSARNGSEPSTPGTRHNRPG